MGATEGGSAEETAKATPCGWGVPSWSGVFARFNMSAFTCCTAFALLALDGSIFSVVRVGAAVVLSKGRAGGTAADLAAVSFLPLLACSGSVDAGTEPT